jgi:anhydro-N-acetylmuramic acid kinase
MVDDEFFSRCPPKSTGTEYFNLEWLARHLAEAGAGISPADVEATLVHLTAKGIAQGLREFLRDVCDEVFFCGGGVHNTFLMEVIATALGRQSPLPSTASLGIDPDWVEAAAFAWLARETLSNRPGNLTSVTGAQRACVLGAVYPGTQGP